MDEAQIDRAAPRQAFERLIAENDALIRGPGLDNGRMISSGRTAIYSDLVRPWAEDQQRTFGYDRPFAVVALGGTGRGEMTPWSDIDFSFLFDDAVEGNVFLLELQRQILHSDEFERRHGFACLPLPFSFDDVPNLTGKQLNSFLDMRPVYDPAGLAELFRDRIRSTYDPFEHFLHVRGFWKDQWEEAATASERLDRFDIKNDGLRVFLAGIWTLAGKNFVHSQQIYEQLDDPRDLAAYDFLLRIRAFIHLRRASKRKRGRDASPDVLGFEDFLSFGELLPLEADEQGRFEFANEVRARLLSARRRVACFAKGVIERELTEGRAVSPGSRIVYGVNGLRDTGSSQCQSAETKSRAALSLLGAAQRYGVPIDPSELQTTFRNAGDWLMLVPELSALFYDQRGSLADSFAFLSQLDGAEERLFPGYAKFESSVDYRVMIERAWLRSALERRKMRALEQYVLEGHARLAGAVTPSQLTDLSRGVTVEIEAALLDADHLAAVKLALKTKRLPLTERDQAARLDQTRALRDRYSSGFSTIPLEQYYAPYAAQADFTPETARLAEFLVANRRAFQERAEAGLNDARQVDEFARLCQNENQLRALFVFTGADHAEWESERSDPARWFNTRELYSKTLARFRTALELADPLAAAGYSAEQISILRDFGEDFFSGVYRQYANRFGAHLVRLAEAPESTGPRANLFRDGASRIVGVAARDYRGLAASICGALWHQQVDLRQAHLFSAMNYGLALDFFHLRPQETAAPPTLTTAIQEAVERRLFIADADEAGLPEARGEVRLHEWRPGLYCLRFETPQNVGGLIYAITYKLFRHLRANIFGLTAHAARGRVFVAVYHHLPQNLPLPEAQRIASAVF